MMRLKTVWVLVFIFAMVFHSAAPGRAEGLDDISITPPEIQIGLYYSGKQLNISGMIPSGGDVLVGIEGPLQHQTFNIKGKVGPLWMNTGKVEIDHIPSLYLLLLPEGEIWQQRLASMGIGLEKLKSDMVVASHNLSKDEIFKRFVQLKQSEGLYATLGGAVSYAPATKEKKRFEAGVFFPSAIAPDDYKITLTYVHDGAIKDTVVRTIPVKEVGVVKSIRRLANQRELAYGIACVIIALFFGIVMGLIFKGGGGGH
jgi:hypothetical protein